MTDSELDTNDRDFPHDDVIDTRDLHELSDELEELAEADELSEHNASLWAEVQELHEITDWPYGEILIHEDYFNQYAQQLAEDIGAVSSSDQWPLYCIDWKAAADELKTDYTPYTVEGETYYARA